SRPDEQSREVVCSALVAVGLLGDRAAVPELLRWLREEKAGGRTLTDLELSFVAAALGKIGQPGLAGPESREVVDALRDRLRKKDRMTRYSAAIALGQVAPQADGRTQRDCIASLTDVIRHDGKATSDTQTVNFALASVGRIGGAPSATEEIRDQAIRTIGAAFENGKGQTASFAALALGLAGMHSDAKVKAPLASMLRGRLSRDLGDADRSGAIVIALGLLRDIQAAGQLQDILLQNDRDPALRGLAAVALGLIGEPGAIEPIRKVLHERSEEKLRVEAAVALGLLRDPGAVKILVDILKDDKSSQFVLGSVTQALGQIGDQDAIAPLVAVLVDPRKQYTNLTRALAAVARGQMGDTHDVPVLSRLSKDVNYRAYFNAIGEVLTIL
ncbi:MAG TPA: HEAT repeat domain-containing protein, partial [Planctomycetota bacterium]|nr:HEAT repeat domain-containing protein [Planctomycetota bacterium]